MTTIQSRRVLIMVLLLSVAVAGAVMRQYAPRGSTTRDVGTLLLVMWVPAVGNLVGWLIGRYKQMRAAAVPAPPGFAPGSVFQPQARVELTLRPAAVPAEDGPLPEGEHRCAFVVDNQAFSVRWFVAPDELVRRGVAHAVRVEFLVPAAALPVFQPDTAFRMLVGPAFVADGRVLEVLGHG